MPTSGNNPYSWHKSARCGHESQCVEIAASAHRVAVRDSKAAGREILLVGRTGWREFVTRAKSGHFDVPGTA